MLYIFSFFFIPPRLNKFLSKIFLHCRLLGKGLSDSTWLCYLPNTWLLELEKRAADNVMACTKGSFSLAGVLNSKRDAIEDKAS